MDIVQNGDPVLRKVALPVPEEALGSKELRSEIDRMISALDAEEDGVALAAPQIGISKRIFVVRYDRMLPPPEADEPPHPTDIGVFVNPEFVKKSRRKEEMEEGCLSVRGIYGTTVRHAQATVRAYDERGFAFERGGGGILAQAFQHEIDHLDGMLFIDNAIALRELHKDTDEDE